MPADPTTIAKKCAWREPCSNAVSGALLCGLHRALAVRDYIYVNHLNPCGPSLGHIDEWLLVSAMKKRGKQKARTRLRKATLARNCERGGCIDTDTIDEGFSCRNCFATTPADPNQHCAHEACPAGRLRCDKFCSWHTQNYYVDKFARCYMCKEMCPVGRLCDKCITKCQFVTNPGKHTICGRPRTRASRFCSSHNTI